MDTIFILNSSKQVVDILSNNGSNPSAPFFDDTYKAELDSGAESYEFTTLANARTTITLEVGNYVLFKFDDKFKLFQIMDTEEEHLEGKKLITCYCEMAGMELLNDYCEPFSLEANFVTFMNTVLQDTNWVLGKYSASLADNIQSVRSEEHENVYKLIQNNLITYGGVEIEFRVEFIGNQLVGQYIDCYEIGTRGNRTYKRFEYGEDVKGITRTRNIDDLATAVIGVGKNDIDFKTIEWKAKNGDPCNKPLEQNFVVDEEANDIWNNNGKYIKTVYKSDTDDPGTLLQESWDYLQKIKQPKFDYDVELALLSDEYQDLRVGDTNYVVDFDYSPAILLEARVGTLELSFSDSRNNKCTLTNYKELTSMILPYVNGDMVDSMIESKFPIGGDKIAQGAIGEGHINVTYYQAIKADIIQAGLIETETLIAEKADIEDLRATNAEIDNLKANKADIVDLTATNANITNLKADVADIKTLVNGNLTSSNIQSLNLTAANTTIDNALIKDAMISNVNASKINAGILNTNNVVIQSEDGGILMSGSTQQFKDSSGTVRIQIGRDAENNFTFALFSQDGVGVLIDETGIKTGAVPNGLIVNDMISEEANISGGKIDITSLFSEMNDSTSTLKSSKIYFDDSGQTLQVAFNTLKNRVDTISQITVEGDLTSIIEQVTTNTTNIEAMQGQISSLITNTTITKENGTVVQLKDAYNSTVSTVNSNTTKIGSLETNYNKVTGDIASVKSKQTALESNLNGFKTTVSNTYVTKDTYNNLKIGGENLLRHTDYSIVNVLNNYSASNGGELQVTQYTFGKDSVDDAFIKNQYLLRNRYDIETAITNGMTYSMTKWKDDITLNANTEYTLSMYLYLGANCGETYFAVYPIVNGEIGTRVCKSDSITTYSGEFVKLEKTFNTGSQSTIFSVRIYNYHNTSKVTGNSDAVIFHPKLEEGNKATDWTVASADVATTATMNSAIDQKADSILSTVSSTYATQASVDTVNGKFANYSTTAQMDSAIKQKSDSILSTVSSTYATQASLDNTNKNLANNYSTTTQMDSAIKQKSDSILSTVSGTYATKEALSDVNGKFNSYSTTVEMDSAITQKANEISTTVSKVEKKARTNYVNQVVNSDCLNSIEGWYTPHSDKISTYITTSNKPESKNAIRLDCRESRVYMNSKKFPVSPGETYTVSMWGQRQPYNSFLRMYMMFSDNDTADNNYFNTYSYKTWDANDGDNAWVYKTMTVTVPDGASHAFIKIGAESTQTTTNYDGRGYFCSLMCNKGDEAATWTGNTNDSYIDLNSRVSSAEVKISDTISSTVRKDGVISSINQSAEAVKVKAKKIELNGAVTIADSNGDSVKIDDADYSIMNGSTERGFFGLRKLDDDRKIARLAMSHSGLDKAKNNYFVATAYPATNNPIDSEKSYFDLAYRCQMFTSPTTGVGDVSNIRMLGDGNISVAPIKNFQIRSNYVNGAYAGDEEHLIAEFGTSSSNYYQRYLSIQTILREGTSNGLLLAHKNDNGNLAIVRIIAQMQDDGTVFRAFSPLTTGGNIRLGSASYPWYRCYATLAESVTSDRRAKENIEYIEETQNPNTTRSTEYTLEDMYNFVKDDLALATYNMKDEEKSSGLKYGFIAQDIVNTKIGYNIIDQSNEDDYIGYDTMNYTNALAGALKEAINKIEQQQEQINQLTVLINKLINKEGDNIG